MRFTDEQEHVMGSARPLTADEQTADDRIVSRGIPFLDANYPKWRSDFASAEIMMADPRYCPICRVEKAVLMFGKTGPRDYHSIAWHTRPGPTFFDVLKKHGMSIDDAIACGFARAKSDPPTFYAALRDRWFAHCRMDASITA